MLNPDPTRVILFSGQGTFGREHYANHIQGFARDLAVHERIKISPEEETRKATETEIVEKEDEVWKKIRNEKVDMVIFFSASDHPTAQRIRKEFPNVTVFLVTGKAIEDQPFIIPKEFVNQSLIEAIARF